MNVMLGTFAKKRNSTALPSGSQTSISGTLRAGCSIQNPIIGFAENRMSTPAAYNYAYITQFARYYFIQDWKWEGGLWWAYMEVDVMGSFKTGIGLSSCYVLRSASEWDNKITDELYPAIGYRRSSQYEFENPLAPDGGDFSEGTYIVGIIGQDGGAGAVSYYGFSPTFFRDFRNQLLSGTNYIGITEITDNLMKALTNPYQYVTSAIWFPFSISTSAANNVKLGWWELNALAGTVSNLTVDYEVDETCEFELEGSSPKAFMYSSPFATYTCFLPPFGEIELDPQIIAEHINIDDEDSTYSSLSLNFRLVVDLITGNGYIYIMCSGVIIGFREGKVGVPVQLGQVSSNISGGIAGTVQSVINGVATASKMGSAAGLAIAGLGAITSATNNIFPKTQTVGMNAGIALYEVTPYVQITMLDVVGENIQENGRPLCKTKTISSLSGYIKTMNADVVIQGATDSEQERIRAMMNGGFFYE